MNGHMKRFHPQTQKLDRVRASSNTEKYDLGGFPDSNSLLD